MQTITHEHYIAAVRDAMLRLADIDSAARERITRTKVVYGSLGGAGLRGIAQYGAWHGKACQHGSDCGEIFPHMHGENGCACRSHNLIEICAAGEENWVQLAGTTVHEFAHVAAGPGTGHGKEWVAMCKALGLRHFRLHGSYTLASFKPALRHAIVAMPHPTDGVPAHLANGPLVSLKFRPCGAGIGTRGGKSRGKGSGSRLRKFVCGCGVIVRAARDELNATCDDCGSKFAPG